MLRGSHNSWSFSPLAKTCAQNTALRLVCAQSSASACSACCKITANCIWNSPRAAASNPQATKRGNEKMCGICGIFEFAQQREISPDLVRRMTDTIVHRGPDDEGIHVGPGIGLGFRRLSIIDLAGGHQPLSNEDGTVWVMLNGEIYNYPELRRELLDRGHRFSTHSDTETIVHLYEECGTECFARLRGMFAIALWDSRRRQLVLARDRVGKKPLYYAADSKRILFGSELKCLLAGDSLPRDINIEAL